VNGRLPGLYVVDVDRRKQYLQISARRRAGPRSVRAAGTEPVAASLSPPSWFISPASRSRSIPIRARPLPRLIEVARQHGRPRSRSTPTSVRATGEAICRAPDRVHGALKRVISHCRPTDDEAVLWAIRADAPSSGCRPRHCRDRGDNGPSSVAWRRLAAANSYRCPKWWCRSTPCGRRRLHAAICGTARRGRPARAAVRRSSPAAR